MDVNIYPAPNPAVSAILIGDYVRGIVRDIGYLGEALYREEVAKRTGALARATHVGTELGGTYHDRWIAVLTVGGGAAADYDLAHEFGANVVVDGDVVGGYPGAHDLNQVLEILSVAMYV